MEARRFHIVWLNVLLVAVLAAAWLAVPRPIAAQGNLLNNGDFEQAHGDGVSLSAPPGWRVTSNAGSGLVGRQLKVGSEVVASAGIYSGSGSFDAYKGWAAYSISLYQTVSGIQSGSTLRLTAFGRMWSCDSDAEEASDACITGTGGVVAQTFTGASFRVGIDPTGSDDPSAAGIVWSGTTAPYEAFQQMVVDATAQGDRVTVVLSASMQQPARHQHVFWDAASLALTSGSAGTGQTAAAAPSGVAAVVVPQGPQADGSIVHTVRSGDTLAGIAYSYNVTIPELLDLNGLTNEDARLIYPGQELVVKAGTGSAPSEAETAEGGTAEASDQTAPEEGDVQPIESYADAPVDGEDLPVVFMGEAVTTGRVCALLFEDVNPNRLREGGEGLLAGGQISLLQGGGEVESHVTDGMSEPYCFEDLTPGSYLIALNPPSGYGATTASAYIVTLSAGKQVTAEFGAAAGFVPPQPAAGQGGTLFSDEAGAETDTVAGPLDPILDNLGYIVLGLAGIVLVGGLGVTALLRR
jgi:LysM repeat protein